MRICSLITQQNISEITAFYMCINFYYLLKYKNRHDLKKSCLFLYLVSNWLCILIYKDLFFDEIISEKIFFSFIIFFSV